ncbi:MAG: glycosyltransferase family 4 protein [Gammaproteobacteria bacterium]|nr:glycosyltransferase family 4 protein [Gammaproteobacteria bacterium]
MPSSARKLKLCFVIPSHWAGSYGGAEQQVRLLIDALIQQKRFELTYITRKASESYKPEGYVIEKVKSGLLAEKLGLFLDARALLAALNKIRPDVIYQRMGCSYTGIAAFYAKKNSCRMIWHIANDVNVLPFHLDKNKSYNIVSRYLEKKILEYGIRNSGGIIAQTNQQAEMLRTYYGCTAEQVIPNFQPISVASRKRNDLIKVVWVANLKPAKRPELFVNLANELHSNSGIEFIMIGRSGHSAWHKDLMGRIKSAAHLRYLGELPQDEVNAILSEAHIFVNTSEYEGFPNTFIQAWMREVPVVSLEINPDGIFNDRRVGFFSGNYKQMCADVLTIASDERLRSDMGSHARRHAMKNHSLDNISRIMEVIESG